jgi:hypothetical protein
MPNYRSLVAGGYYSDGRAQDEKGHKVPVSVRSNNPGAINGAAWERSYPGYVTDYLYDGHNNTTIFETPEHGTAAWFELMRKYRAMGHTTLGDIIWTYGGGQANYHAYAGTVSSWTGLPPNYTIQLDGSDDENLLKFAKAMFRYESGLWPLPWSDEQIRYGIAMGRNGGREPAKAPSAPSAPQSSPKQKLLWLLIDLVRAVLKK